MIGGNAEDIRAIERQVETLSRIDQVVKDGVKSLNGMLCALKWEDADLQSLEDIRRYKIFIIQ